MNRFAEARNSSLWVGLSLTAVLLVLPLTMIVLGLRRPIVKPLPVLGQIADFTLTNQFGQPVSLAALRGHVWVADIIFTRCPGPCLKMTRQMKDLQQALPPASSARLVTLTTDPEFDTPAVMNRYSERFGADPKRWLFLTGAKEQIAAVAAGSLKLTAVEKKPEERQSPVDLFIHSTICVLVDKQGRLRGIFETTGEGIEPEQVKAQLLAAISRLDRGQ